ncbi:uncharacterized protein SAPINGB_P000668 [Magnusiomyces paraingens]|uniref:Large ribosomal subunit protein uL30m n=1 Tax=Magnusiomyces paraingens TaxID=2606893 RepID=A0A5E8B8S9_9ASCO|nr:uncharacterized protein SAPINGB_P000668 [Saprochaete ingens]VVT45192.1 unnamed protein product [Saprochaete ingens]
MYYRIHLYRSFIGLSKTTAETCRALGLSKRGRVVYKKVSPQIAGQVVKIKDLVKVDLVPSLEYQTAEFAARKSASGYSVISRN